MGQQPENIQHSMQYIKETLKPSVNQPQPNLNSPEEKTSEEEVHGRESSVLPTPVEEKPVNPTPSAPAAKEVSQTPAEVERIAKEMEAQKAAYEKHVKDLEA